MSFQESMMRWWVGRKRPEELESMMGEMMPQMMEKMGSQGMPQMMEKMGTRKSKI